MFFIKKWKNKQLPSFITPKTTPYLLLYSPLTLSQILVCVLGWLVYIFNKWHNQSIQYSNQSLCRDSGVTKNSGSSWGKQNSLKKSKKRRTQENFQQKIEKIILPICNSTSNYTMLKRKKRKKSDFFTHNCLKYIP